MEKNPRYQPIAKDGHDRPHKKWRRDFTIEPWRDRMMSILCGVGLLVPIGRGVKEGTYPWQWPGDRLILIVLFLAIGILSINLTSED